MTRRWLNRLWWLLPLAALVATWAWLRPVAGFQPDWNAILVGAILIGTLVNYPIPVGDEEISTAHAVSITLGLTHGPGVMGLALAVGLAAGELVRGGLKGAPAPRRGTRAERARASLVGWSLQSLSLFGSLTVYQLAGGRWVMESGGLPAPVPGLALALSFALLFSALHWVNHQLTGSRSLDRNERAVFALVALVPIPFAAVSAAAYAVLGAPALVILGGVVTLVSPILRSLLDAKRDLQRRLQEFATISSVSQAMQTSLDLDSLLSAIHVQVTDLLNVDSFYIALRDPDESQLSYPLAVKNGIKEHWPTRPVADRLTDRVIRTRTTILVEADGPRALREMALPELENSPQAWLGVPLVNADRSLGCMAVFHTRPGGTLTTRDMDILLALAGQAAVAIDHSLLFEQTRSRAEALASLNQIAASMSSTLDPERALELVSLSVVRVGGGQKSAIFLLDRDQEQLNLARATHLSEAFVQSSAVVPLDDLERTEAFHSGAPVLVADVASSHLPRAFVERLQAEEISAFAEFPLISPSGTIGQLNVYFAQPQHFHPEQVELLKTFAAQAALAVANARAHAETDQALGRRVEQLSILETIGREMTATLDQNELFQAILGHALRITGAELGHLAIAEPSQDGLRIVAQHGSPEGSPAHDRSRVHSADQGIPGRAFRLGASCNVPELEDEPDHVDLSGAATRSLLSVPVLRQGRCLAVITLESLRPGAFSIEDEQLVSQLAASAAVALTNASLYEQLEARLREQSFLYQASTQIAATLESEGMALAVADSLAVALSADAASLSRWDPGSRRLHLQSAIQDGQPAKRGWTADIALEEAPGLGACVTDGEAVQWSLDSAPSESDRQYLSHLRHTSSLLGVPLMAGKQCLGVIEVFSHSPRLFDDNEVRTARTIASQAAIGLQNTDLFRRISESHDRLMAVLNSTQEGMLMVDTLGRVVLANPRLEALTGLPVRELIASDLSEPAFQASTGLGYRPGELAHLLAGLRSGQAAEVAVATYEIDLPARRILQRSEAPVRDASGLLIGWLVVVRDVSKERKLEDARRQLTEMIVHDLRSPLTAILSSLKILNETAILGPESPVARQALSVSHRSCQQMLGLVNSLLDIARLETGEMELCLKPVSLEALCQDLLATYVHEANEQGVILKNRFAPALPLIEADEEKLTRVLANLLDNALKFTPAGGQVDLTIEPEAESILITVSDTGPGVPEDFREGIFERFAQVPGTSGRRHGTGLGLAFSKLAVEAHSGSIWVEENPEGGSRFRIRLPARRA